MSETGTDVVIHEGEPLPEKLQRSPEEAAYRVLMHQAKTIAESGLFGFKTPQQALAIMLVAQAEGRHPALAARDYDVIQGRPAKKAEAMLRDFLAAGGKVEWYELSDKKASASFSHPSGGTVPIEWDHARAKQAGLDTKDMYRKYPRQMLRSRCVSEGVRTVYPAATSGMYVPEEVHDIVDESKAGSTPARSLSSGETGGGFDSHSSVSGETKARPAQMVSGAAESAPQGKLPKGFNLAGEPIVVGVNAQSPLFGKSLSDPRVKDADIVEACLWAGKQKGYESWMLAAQKEQDRRANARDMSKKPEALEDGQQESEIESLFNAAKEKALAKGAKA